MKNKTPFCDLFLLLFNLNHFFSSHDSFKVLVKLLFFPSTLSVICWTRQHYKNMPAKFYMSIICFVKSSLPFPCTQWKLVVGNRIIFSDSSFYESFTEVNWVFESND